MKSKKNTNASAKENTPKSSGPKYLAAITASSNRNAKVADEIPKVIMFW